MFRFSTGLQRACSLPTGSGPAMPGNTNKLHLRTTDRHEFTRIKRPFVSGCQVLSGFSGLFFHTLCAGGVDGVERRAGASEGRESPTPAPPAQILCSLK